MGGHRVPGLQVLTVYFLFFIMHKINYKQVTIVSIGEIILMNTLAIYGGSLILGDFSFFRGVKNISEKMFAFDTAYYSYLASLTSIGSMGFYSLSERIVQLLDFMGF